MLARCRVTRVLFQSGARLGLRRNYTNPAHNITNYRPTKMRPKADRDQGVTHFVGASSQKGTSDMDVDDEMDSVSSRTEDSGLKVHETVLSNGLRVTSFDIGEPVTAVGFFSNCGSAYETKQSQGLNYILELMSFKSTKKRSTQDILEFSLSLGGQAMANVGRDQYISIVEAFRAKADDAVELIAECTMTPLLMKEELDEFIQVLPFLAKEANPDAMIRELLTQASFIDQPLGNPLGSLEECDRGEITPELLRYVQDQHFFGPNCVLAACGIDHDHFVSLAEQHFGATMAKEPPAASSYPPLLSSLYPQPTRLEVVDGANGATAAAADLDLGPGMDNLRLPPSSLVPARSIYSPGVKRSQRSYTIDDNTRVGVAWPIGGWRSRDLIPACVLQTLLGGGASFSAGGPGKGMYSRLYTQVLNRYGWVESAEAMVDIHDHIGIIGLCGSVAHGQDAESMLNVLCKQFYGLATDEVSPGELDRAKNMVKINVMSQMESRLVLCEDLGRQYLTYGHREGQREVCERIDRVEAKDLKDLVRRAMGVDGSSGGGIRPLAMAVTGPEADKAPSYETVLGWFK